MALQIFLEEIPFAIEASKSYIFKPLSSASGYLKCGYFCYCWYLINYRRSLHRSYKSDRAFIYFINENVKLSGARHLDWYGRHFVAGIK